MSIVPYLFSMWAVFHGREPATRFKLNREDEEAYAGRAQGLLMKELGDSVESVWDSIPSFDRSLMVSMFLSRPTMQELVVHITPTIEQAKHIIDSDSHLYPAEKASATEYFPFLLDKHNKGLFN